MFRIGVGHRMGTQTQSLGSLESRLEHRSFDSQSSALSTTLCHVVGA